MTTYQILIGIAGLINLGLIVASFFIPAKLDYKKNMASLPPIHRQIFHAQHNMIAVLIVWVSLVCFFCVPDIIGGSLLGKFFAAFMVVFWVIRFCFQTFYFDSKVKRENRLVNLIYSTAFVYQAVVFSLAFLEVPL